MVVSAFLLTGRLNRIVDLVLAGSFTWLISPDILEEYAAVASRPVYRLSGEELESFLYQIKERAEWVHVTSSLSVIQRDPADDKFLACVIDGRASRIVSGDRHLLGLRVFRGIRIVTPSEFLRVVHPAG